VEGTDKVQPDDSVKAVAIEAPAAPVQK
jgi:hypothetical protein